MTPYQLHKKSWIDCQRCPLYETRKNVVLVRGSLPCDILMVGEAPGISEDALGKPFCGPAGKLLDRQIAAASPGLLKIAFTNVIACIPYDGEGKKVADPADWPEESIKECSPRLNDLVRIARPRVIVTVGKVAEKRVKELEGSEACMITTHSITHPAAILRANPAMQGIMYQKVVVTLSELFQNFIPY